MTGDPKWHERTPTLLAASVAALLAVAMVVWLTMFVVRQVNAPAPPPEYVTPTFTDQSSDPSSTSTTGATTTRSVQPETSDILTTEPTESTTTTTTRERTTNTPRTRDRVEEGEGADGGEDTTTRRRPRYNETRTLYPVP